MLYDNIKEICEKKKISIRTLEIKAGLGNGTIGKWNKPDAQQNLDSVMKVANALGVSVDRLIRKSG